MIEQADTVPNRSETWDCSAKINPKKQENRTDSKSGIKKQTHLSNIKQSTNSQRYNVTFLGIDLNHLPKIHPVEIVTCEDVEEINPSIFSKVQWCW